MTHDKDPRTALRFSLDGSERLASETHDAFYFERLERLRAVSNTQNKILQTKLLAAGLPYVSRNSGVEDETSGGFMTRPKAARVAILYRPEFYHSDEQDKASARYQGKDDQFTIFFHVEPDGGIQLIRGYTGCTKSWFGDVFIQDLLTVFEGQKKRIKDAFRRGDLDDVAMILVDALTRGSGSENKAAQRATESFSAAGKLATIDEVAAFFQGGSTLLFVAPDEIIRNVAKIALTSVMEIRVREAIMDKRSPREILAELFVLAEDVLHIRPEALLDDGLLGDFIPNVKDFVQQTIYRLMKLYKPWIQGWKKDPLPE